jgi:hypothetical protein
MIKKVKFVREVEVDREVRVIRKVKMSSGQGGQGCKREV